MRKTLWTTGLLAATVIVVIIAMSLSTSRTADAYNSYECGDDDFVHWSGGRATFDVAHGGFPAWWKSEIIHASGVWDAPSVGADFNFVEDDQSANDWTKRTRLYNSRIAETYFRANGETCHITEVDTWFNTRYSFAICDDCNDGTYDVRTVAIHEFGHWLVLDHVPWNRPWDYDCVMWLDHGTDHSLCGHDIAGIVEIYGAD